MFVSLSVVHESFRAPVDEIYIRQSHVVYRTWHRTIRPMTAAAETPSRSGAHLQPPVGFRGSSERRRAVIGGLGWAD